MQFLSHILVGFFRGIIHLYRFILSPVIGPCCRFTPSCSEYALEALRVLPLLQALPKILWRLLRCQPWGGHGLDPVTPPHTHLHS